MKKLWSCIRQDLICSFSLTSATSVEMEEMEEFKGPQMKPQRLTCQTYDKKRTADIATSQFTSDDLSLATCQEYCIKASSVFMGITVRVKCRVDFNTCLVLMFLRS